MSGRRGSRSFLFVTPEGDILLDAALPESVPQIEANIQKLGFKLTDIKYLLNSHAHFDHSGGLAQMKIDTGAKLVASEGDRSALEGGFYLGSESVTAMSAPPVKVDRVVKDGDTLNLGGFTLTAHLTPGHTRGCTSWGWTVHDGGKSSFRDRFLLGHHRRQPAGRSAAIHGHRGRLPRDLREGGEDERWTCFSRPHPEFYRLAEKRAKIADRRAQPVHRSGRIPELHREAEGRFRNRSRGAGSARRTAKGAAAN